MKRLEKLAEMFEKETGMNADYIVEREKQSGDGYWYTDIERYGYSNEFILWCLDRKQLS